MSELHAWLQQLRQLLEIPLVKMGETPITVWTLIYLLGGIVLLFWAARWVQVLLSERILARTGISPSAQHAAAAIARYLMLLIGLLIIIQTAGIDLTTLNVLAGAVGIGVGFGLQNVISNFFSGLIIMFERPIKVGDRIVVDGIEGDVWEIGARSTVLMTNDNIAMIVPNSKFITENVVNWKYNDGKVRFRIPIGVAYGSDVRVVEKALLEVADNTQDVMKFPAPAVRLMRFGDSALEFELRVWSETQVHHKGALTSTINMAICEKFAQLGIEIPFPQRDLNIRNGTVDVRLTK